MNAPADWLVELDTCPSTNTWALEHLDQLSPGSVVYTQQQTGGRGRDGRAWASPPGVLTASLIVATPGPDPRLVALAAGLAVVHAIEDRCAGIELGIKWPNDVTLAGRKLGGILCEGRSGRVVVGCGVNLSADLPAELVATATSLHQHAAPPPTLELLAAIRGYLLEGIGLLALRGLSPLLPQLRRRDVLQGRRVTVDGRNGQLVGTGAGIDESGRLLVVVPGGGKAVIDAGHVTGW
ncbi:MAG: biotin--[acetyl-CoA-carboxylase] ligase [Planctomycetota bacterium]